jgi:hypothetical protein
MAHFFARTRGLRLHFLILLLAGASLHAAGPAVYNVKDFGATGRKSDDARVAIQKAIDECAKSGGGMVYLPPGEYTSGTIHMRSHVRLHIEAGATLFASPDPKAYDYGAIPSKAALIYGEDVENISIEGRGTVDGQAEYDWRPDDFERAYNHKMMMEKLGKSLMRSFPRGFPPREVFPHLVWLGRCKDVHITGLTFLRSPSWSITLYDCERMVIDGLYIYTSLKEAVWADGIDMDGCRDIRIANCRIETGDDCFAFISTDSWGPARLCENITITNCVLSSASAAFKFSEGNKLGIRHIAVDNCVILNTNRGFCFTITTGGTITDIVITNLTMDLHRYEWFWDGDGQPFFFRITRLSEWNQEPPQPGEPPPGRISNVMIQNVIVRAQGGSLIAGHPESWLDGVTLDNVKLFLSTDPAAPYELTTHALDFRWAKNVKVKEVEVTWEAPVADKWESALSFEDVSGLVLDGFAGRQAWPERDVPAVVFNKVSDAVVRNSRAMEGTKTFLNVSGKESNNIVLFGNDFRKAQAVFTAGEDVSEGAVQVSNSLP